MRDTLRVRVRGEFVALIGKILPKRAVVLDYTVVDDRDFAGAVRMRVRVDYRGFAMRRPARVCDAYCRLIR